MHRELDGLREELSRDGLSRAERDAKAARWYELQRRLHSNSKSKGGVDVTVDYASFEPAPSHA